MVRMPVSPAYREAATLYWDSQADANAHCVAVHAISRAEGRGRNYEEAFARLKAKLRELYGQMPQDPAIPVDAGGWRSNF
jgi:hypothetical protein